MSGVQLVSCLGSLDSEKDPAGYEAFVDWLNHGAETEPEPENVVEHDEWEPELPDPPRPDQVW